MFLRTITTVALLATSIIAITPASARTTIVVNPDGSTVATVAVSYADLDLTSAAGRETLERRVHAAARQVCRNESSIRAEGACRSKARAQGAQRIALVVDRAGPAQLAALGQ